MPRIEEGEPVGYQLALASPKLSYLRRDDCSHVPEQQPRAHKSGRHWAHRRMYREREYHYRRGYHLQLQGMGVERTAIASVGRARAGANLLRRHVHSHVELICFLEKIHSARDSERFFRSRM